MQIATMQKVVPIERKAKTSKLERAVRVSQKEVAKYFGVSVSTVSRWGNEAVDPLPTRRTRGVLTYDWQEVLDWEERNTIRNGAQL